MRGPGALREDLSRLREIDGIAVGSAAALLLVGVFSIYSAVAGKGDVAIQFALRQLVWGVMGGVVFVAAFSVGYERVLKYSYWIYAASLLLLVAVLVAGYTARGAKSWFDFGALRLQPAEPVKVALALFLASFLTRYPPKGIMNISGAILLSSLAPILVLLQPDLGTVTVYAFMIFAALVAAGTPKKYLFSMTGAVLFSLPLGWSMLKEYQKLRMLVFINPSLDPLGAGYNVIQSRIAVGAGGILGKGFLKGSQSKLHFLPEPHTDFIFSVFSEEFGFVGAVIVLALFAVILWRMVRTALRSGDERGQIIVAAISAWIWFQVFENIAMSVGIAPVTGLALPFVSYGGSSLVSLGAALGLVQSVHVAARQHYD
ncbi:MAG: rod shape-determining protein RodA [Thermovirgaceae bacterium]|nr:rod shape-determining protein RodA [Thermovirgaceae bacterium]